MLTRARIAKIAQSICLAYVHRHTPADLQRGNGDEQKRRARGPGLADHVRLQHVFVSGFKMGRWNLVRTHPSIDGVASRISYDHSRCLALAA